MKKLAWICSLVIFLLIPCVHGASAEPYMHHETGLVFPERLAGMDRGKVTDFETEQPGLGVSIGYNAPGITVTIYLYNMGMESVPDSLQSPVFRSHFKQVVDDVVQAGQLGYYGNLKKTSETAVSLSALQTGPNALCASFIYIQNDVERLSKLYLLPFRKHFLKVRFTYDRNIQSKAEDTLKKFLDYLAVNVMK